MSLPIQREECKHIYEETRHISSAGIPPTLRYSCSSPVPQLPGGSYLAPAVLRYCQYFFHILLNWMRKLTSVNLWKYWLLLHYELLLLSSWYSISKALFLLYKSKLNSLVFASWENICFFSLDMYWNIERYIITVYIKIYTWCLIRNILEQKKSLGIVTAISFSFRSPI